MVYVNALLFVILLQPFFIMNDASRRTAHQTVDARRQVFALVVSV